MAQSQIKAESGNDLTPAGEDTLDFDGDTLRGEKKSLILFIRIFQYTVNSLVSDHPWYSTKWSLTGKINKILP